MALMALGLAGALAQGEAVAQAIPVGPDGLPIAEICGPGARALPHLGQVWPASALSRIALFDRRKVGLGRVFASPVAPPAPGMADFVVVEMVAPGPFDPPELWLRVRPSDRADGSDAWFRYAADGAVDPAVRQALDSLPAQTDG